MGCHTITDFRSRIGLIVLMLFFHFLSSGWIWGDSLALKNREGNRLYKDGRIDEALSKWRDAQIENPDNDKLHYNIGNGLHEQKSYKDAFKEYEKSLDSKNSELRSKAYYNIGNTRYRMGELPEAIEDYKKCLEINPKDEDAKYNIEFIKKRLKEQPKKEDQQQKESRQKKEEENQQKQGQYSKSQEERRAEQQKDQAASEAQNPEEDKEKQEKANQAQGEKQQGQEEKKEARSGEEKQKSSGEETKGKMSKEDAVRLLDAMKDDEKDLQKELRNQPVEGQYRVDKDW